uniref:Band 7 domain-containing protein n=1 Tax=Skeletonema marinoi TaxID=267567 RepID=A0A6U3U7Z4_9STRA|mmetsp:Transcript_11438/g.22917  ORF Transcript_11438/g.22917 Transcript_11438/m.22917 type:complete len:279 (-) Transcript_11438:1489-2325(-)
MCCPCCLCVSTSEVVVVERLGKFDRFLSPGFNLIWCPCEQHAGSVSFRVQQLDVRVETKTKDNVFLTTVVSVQYQVIREKAYQAFYALTNTQQQITAHIYDVMRSQLPTLELDAVFEAKEDLALAVKNALQETMSGYGYQILQALITDIDPDQRVKNAMNEINSAKRLKFAIAEKAEGQKILQVKSAEAEAEAKYLSGVGVAKQRKAIVDGLRTSIVDFSGNIKGATSKDVMDLLLLTQYFDCIRDVGSANHCKTTFVSSSSGGIRDSLLVADAAKLK